MLVVYAAFEGFNPTQESLSTGRTSKSGEGSEIHPPSREESYYDSREQVGECVSSTHAQPPPKDLNKLSSTLVFTGLPTQHKSTRWLTLRGLTFDRRNRVYLVDSNSLRKISRRIGVDSTARASRTRSQEWKRKLWFTIHREKTYRIMASS
jgi:hypothetical protein